VGDISDLLFRDRDRGKKFQITKMVPASRALPTSDSDAALLLHLPTSFRNLVQVPLSLVRFVLQAVQDRQVPMIDDSFAQSPDISATGFIPTLTVVLSDSDDGNQQQARRQN
jgi:hypothetical protein